MRPATPVALLAVVAALAGCGGGGNAASYPELQRQAAAICLRYHRGLAKLGAPSTLPRLAKVAQGAHRLGAQERAALERLDPPADARESLARMIDGFRRADALLPSVSRAARAKKIATARTIARRGRAIVKRANRDAVALGLADCRRS